MGQKEILENLSMAIQEGDDEKARKNAREALQSKMDPLKAVDEGLSKGMAVVGQKFEKGEAFLPELLMAADSFHAAMEVLKPEIEAQKKQMVKAGKVVIGTVKSDVHNIGKNIVATVLETNGFEVIDIGIDNPSLKFIEEAQKAKADVIALSSLMTTTMPGQREVVDTLKDMKLREKYFVVVGGGPVSQEWADKIGADGYGSSAVQAVDLIKSLMARKR